MNQIIKGMSEATYSSRVEYIRSSLLKKVITEPLSTVKCIIDGTITIKSDAMKMGTAFHNLLLEGKKDYVIKPETYAYGKKWTRSAKYCEEWEDKQTLPIVSAREVESLEGMVKAIHAHPELKPYLNGQCELSIFVDKIAKLKCRIDLLPRDPAGPVIDFKKARSADPAEFTKQLFDMRYYLSAAMYLDVLRAVDIVRDEFWYVAIEDSYPYNIGICKMVDRPVSFIDAGRREYRQAYHRLMKAMQTNEWPTYPTYEPEEHMTSWMQATLENQ
jgi:hypothetical protein